MKVYLREEYEAVCSDKKSSLIWSAVLFLLSVPFFMMLVLFFTTFGEVLALFFPMFVLGGLVLAVLLVSDFIDLKNKKGVLVKGTNGEYL